MLSEALPGSRFNPQPVARPARAAPEWAIKSSSSACYSDKKVTLKNGQAGLS